MLPEDLSLIMKGIVFTEFLEMVEQAFSPEMADRIIVESQLPHGGAYTAVGTYPHEEIVRLVVQLSQATGTSVPDLVRAFGRHLFQRFVVLYPGFFPPGMDALTFLAGVETHIHAEVLKLYPDAQLPRFETQLHGPDQLVMDYRSDRAMHDLAEGLIEGCLGHFGEPIQLVKEVEDGSGGTRARFTLTRGTG